MSRSARRPAPATAAAGVQSEEEVGASVGAGGTRPEGSWLLEASAPAAGGGGGGSNPTAAPPPAGSSSARGHRAGVVREGRASVPVPGPTALLAAPSVPRNSGGGGGGGGSGLPPLHLPLPLPLSRPASASVRGHFVNDNVSAGSASSRQASSRQASSRQMSSRAGSGLGSVGVGASATHTSASRRRTAQASLLQALAGLNEGGGGVEPGFEGLKPGLGPGPHSSRRASSQRRTASRNEEGGAAADAVWALAPGVLHAEAAHAADGTVAPAITTSPAAGPATASPSPSSMIVPLARPASASASTLQVPVATPAATPVQRSHTLMLPSALHSGGASFSVSRVGSTGEVDLAVEHSSAHSHTEGGRNVQSLPSSRRASSQLSQLPLPNPAPYVAPRKRSLMIPLSGRAAASLLVASPDSVPMQPPPGSAVLPLPGGRDSPVSSLVSSAGGSRASSSSSSQVSKSGPSNRDEHGDGDGDGGDGGVHADGDGDGDGDADQRDPDDRVSESTRLGADGLRSGHGDGDGDGDVTSQQAIDGLNDFAADEEAKLDDLDEEEAAALAAAAAAQDADHSISELGRRVLASLDSGWGMLVFTLATLYCLFGDNIRISAVHPDADLVFIVLASVCLVMFLMEFAAFCRWQKDYLFSFFFFLDVVAIVSLLPELPFIWNPLMAAVGGPSEDEDSSTASSLAAVRAGRAGRAGTRAGRLLRMTRLVRFLRMVKLYKYWGETEEQREKRLAAAKAEKDAQLESRALSLDLHLDPSGSGSGEGAKSGSGGAEEPSMSLAGHALSSSGVSKHGTSGTGGGSLSDSQWNADEDADSQIGAGVSDFITKAVILIVLILLFTLPLLFVEESDSSPLAFAQEVAQLALRQARAQSVDPGDDSNEMMLRHTVEAFQNNYHLLLLYVVKPALLADEEWWAAHAAATGSSLDHKSSSPLESLGLSSDDLLYSHVDHASLSDLRPNEIRKVASTSPAGVALVWVSIRADKKEQALLSIGSTLVVTFLIAVGAALFSKDANDLVLTPISKMFQFVTTLARNPLAKIPEGHGGGGPGGGGGKLLDGKGATRPLETQLLESTFCKLAGLLQIGFGAAGAEIISHNMSGDFLDPLVPGRKTLAIFAFADIRRFNPITEALQESLLAFTNQVAEVVHEAAYRHGGCSNKNLGNAFLLVWKPSPAAIKRAAAVVAKAEEERERKKDELALHQLLHSRIGATSTVGDGGGGGGPGQQQGGHLTATATSPASGGTGRLGPNGEPLTPLHHAAQGAMNGNHDLNPLSPEPLRHKRRPPRLDLAAANAPTTMGGGGGGGVANGQAHPHAHALVQRDSHSSALPGSPLHWMRRMHAAGGPGGGGGAHSTTSAQTASEDGPSQHPRTSLFNSAITATSSGAQHRHSNTATLALAAVSTGGHPSPHATPEVRTFTQRRSITINPPRGRSTSPLLTSSPLASPTNANAAHALPALTNGPRMQNGTGSFSSPHASPSPVHFALRHHHLQQQQQHGSTHAATTAPAGTCISDDAAASIAAADLTNAEFHAINSTHGGVVTTMSAAGSSVPTPVFSPLSPGQIQRRPGNFRTTKRPSATVQFAPGLTAAPHNHHPQQGATVPHPLSMASVAAAAATVDQRDTTDSPPPLLLSQLVRSTSSPVPIGTPLQARRISASAPGASLPEPINERHDDSDATPDTPPPHAVGTTFAARSAAVSSPYSYSTAAPSLADGGLDGLGTLSATHRRRSHFGGGGGGGAKSAFFTGASQHSSTNGGMGGRGGGGGRFSLSSSEHALHSSTGMSMDRRSSIPMTPGGGASVLSGGMGDGITGGGGGGSGFMGGAQMVGGELQSRGAVWETMRGLADHALVAFLQVALTVGNSRDFERWRRHPRLAGNEAALGRPLVPGDEKANRYHIDMGFGLHVGWAIEGAIGSIHKIDASYLSPNVNIAARLDGATRQYGVAMLMSGAFVSLLDDEIRSRCRHLDRITVKGSKQPIDIFTFDIQIDAATPTATTGGASGGLLRQGTLRRMATLRRMSSNVGGGAPASTHVTAVADRQAGARDSDSDSSRAGAQRARVQFQAAGLRDCSASGNSSQAGGSSTLSSSVDSSLLGLIRPAHGLRLADAAMQAPGAGAGEEDGEDGEAGGAGPNPVAPAAPRRGVAAATLVALRRLRSMARGVTTGFTNVQAARNQVAPAAGSAEQGAELASLPPRPRKYSTAEPPSRPEAASDPDPEPAQRHAAPGEAVVVAIDAAVVEVATEAPAPSAVAATHPAPASVAAPTTPIASPSGAGLSVMELLRPPALQSPATPSALGATGLASPSVPLASPGGIDVANLTSPSPVGAAAAQAQETSRSGTSAASRPFTPLSGVSSADSPPPNPLASVCARLQAGLPSEWVSLYNRATRSYIRGRWSRARHLLETRLLPLRPEDKATLHLLAFMKTHGYKAPHNWPGYRKLLDK